MRRKKSANKGHAKFTEQEDNALSQLVEEFGSENWELIAQQMKGRNKRQCKERWMNYLCPSINMDPWSDAEDSLLLEKYAEYGARWVAISRFFTNRTDTMIKNRFQLLKRRESRSERLRTRRSRHANLTNQQDQAPLAEEAKPDDFSFDWDKIDNVSLFDVTDDIFNV